jgi:hypothetical protein
VSEAWERLEKLEHLERLEHGDHTGHDHEEIVDAAAVSAVSADSVRHEPEVLLVFRQDEDTVHEILSAREATAVRALLSGSSFAEICESIADGDDVAAAADAAAGLLSRWLEKGLLSGYRLASPSLPATLTALGPDGHSG